MMLSEMVPLPEPDDDPVPAPEPDDGLVVVGDFLAAELAHLAPLEKPAPDLAVATEASDLAAQVLALKVHDAVTCRIADERIEILREMKRRVEAELNPFIEQANRLHKGLTEKRRQYLEPIEVAIKTVGQRVWQVQRQIEAAAEETRRQRQAEADRQERARLEAERVKLEAEAAERRREAEAARQRAEAESDARRRKALTTEAARLDAEGEQLTLVAEEVKAEEATAVAPAIAITEPTPTLTTSRARSTFKARLKGTHASGEMHAPAFRDFLTAALDGRVPLEYVQIDWTAVNARARADKRALNLPGMEAYEEGGLASRGRRRSQ